MAGVAAGTAAPATGRLGALVRRADVVPVLAGLWVVAGLYVDGWAHQARKPETFFTPWHGLLYSGAVAYAAWGFWAGSNADLAQQRASRAAGLGGALFGVGAVGDLAWHSAFGVEVDLEALMSPTHLLLMTGGVLALALPWRVGAARPRWAIGGLCVAAAVPAFFFQYAVPASDRWLEVRPRFRGPVQGPGEVGRGLAPAFAATGLLGFVVLAALVAGLAVLVVRRYDPPPLGSLALCLGAIGLALGALTAFHRPGAACLGPLAAGLAAEAVARAWPGRPSWAVGGAAGLATGLVSVAGFALTRDLRWQVDLWAGAIAMSALVGAVVGWALDGARPAPAVTP